jgi:hypothetical protein
MLKVGDGVKWKTAARGYRRAKEGEVFAVVPPGTSPQEALQLAGYSTDKILCNYELMFSHFEYWTRKDTSYLILVDDDKLNQLPRLYWPRAIWLKKYVRPKS